MSPQIESDINAYDNKHHSLFDNYDGSNDGSNGNNDDNNELISGDDINYDLYYNQKNDEFGGEDNPLYKNPLFNNPLFKKTNKNNVKYVDDAANRKFDLASKTKLKYTQGVKTPNVETPTNNNLKVSPFVKQNPLLAKQNPLLAKQKK
jgi:hypothetical protein